MKLQVFFSSDLSDNGKTCNLKILKCFFQDGQQFERLAEIYAGKFQKELKIMQDTEFVRDHLGQYFVLLLVLKSMTGYNKQEILEKMIVTAANEHMDVLSSSKDPDIVQVLGTADIPERKMTGFRDDVGRRMVTVLNERAEHFGGKGCIVLVDEYDKLAEHLMRLPVVDGANPATILQIIITSFDKFMRGIVDESTLTKDLLTGRTRYGSALASSVKCLEYMDFLRDTNLAIGFGLAVEQVEELLARRMILRVCEIVPKQQETFDSLHKKLGVDSCKTTDNLRTALKTNYENTAEYSELCKKFDALKTDDDEWFQRMEENFNGFIVQPR
ncbi:unnamed protein product [Bemisia tabaci]|uniref:AAA-ATPase-like domain-containing protein n=1 Tax=Bemisia tabaci TaxID=7038 RepID=A0A9P0F531_BEMTA|nr:unnamed protein product [Bemisia tabaci]